MKREKQENLIPINKLFSQITKNIDKNKHQSIFELWRELQWENLGLPDIVKRKTFADWVTRDRKLIVGVKHAALANELQFHKEKLLNLLNQAIKNANKSIHLKENFSQDYVKELRALVFELR